MGAPDYAHTLVDDGRGGTLMLPPFVPAQNLNRLRHGFDVREDDVFVATYPKAGTTWMEQVVLLLVNRGEQGSLPLGTAVPWVETLPQRPGGLEAFLARMTGRRMFNTHLPVGLMPGVGEGRGRFVCVLRNPRDLAVSFFHHDRSKNEYEGTWHEYFERFISGEVHFGTYLEHLRDWWSAAQESDTMMFVSYEAMKRDLRDVATRVARFIDVDADDALLDRVVEGSSFSAMSTNPKTDLSWVPMRKDRPGHYRRGVVGDWRTHFDEAQVARLDRACQQVLAGTGIAFEYE